MKAKKRVIKKSQEAAIVIDEELGLTFANEEELLKHFKNEIDALESEYLSLVKETDYTDAENEALSGELEKTLETPDLVWRDDKAFKKYPVFHMIRKIQESTEPSVYIASVYIADDVPTFIFLHFATKDPDMVANFTRGELVYDRQYEVCEPASIEGDGLEEGDALAMGLYQAMMTIRAATDVPLERFKEFGPLREETVENADEIWRTVDLSGNTLVSFIKEFPENEEYPDFTYITVTLEDAGSNVHSLLYSFPTTDKTLVDRYRRGENLQAEEVSQESSH
jgi:hypothetical protein